MSKYLLYHAKRMRRHQTRQESELWGFLRNKKMFGLKFYRQYLVAPYIVDFCCPKIKFAIEVDGSTHLRKRQRWYDKLREQYLLEQGYFIFRFWNHEWDENRHDVLEEMINKLRQIAPLPNPLPVMR